VQLFIDESGDPGLRLDRPGTSPHFVLAGVLVESEIAAADCRGGLAEFSGRFRRREFKFNSSDAALREEYLRTAARLPWSYLAVAVEKSRLRPEHMDEARRIYPLATGLLFRSVVPRLARAFIVFDRCGDRGFRRAIAACIRETVEVGRDAPIKRVSAVASHSEPLLQLADMVAGSVARSLRPDAPDAGRYRHLIAANEIGVRRWPPGA
jgi:hypothetical protein